jgi:hypothetical protein
VSTVQGQGADWKSRTSRTLVVIATVIVVALIVSLIFLGVGSG